MLHRKQVSDAAFWVDFCTESLCGRLLGANIISLEPNQRKKNKTHKKRQKTKGTQTNQRQKDPEKKKNKKTNKGNKRHTEIKREMI